MRQARLHAPTSYVSLPEGNPLDLRYHFQRAFAMLTLWKFNVAMENHHFSWEIPLFLWPFSIANC